MLTIMQTVNNDWDELKNTLRDCDKEEVQLLYPDIAKHFDDLKLICSNAWTIIDESGFVVSIFGVQDQGLNIGSVWMLSSYRLARQKKSLIKLTAEIRKLCFADHIKLINLVYKKNLPAIKYLNYVGANFIKEKNVGDFLFFEINKE